LRKCPGTAIPSESLDHKKLERREIRSFVKPESEYILPEMGCKEGVAVVVVVTYDSERTPTVGTHFLVVVGGGEIQRQ
jgi:hypothetical protein